MKQPSEPRVLVIDDNPSIHEDFRKILEGKTVAERAFLEEKRELFGEKPGGPDAQRFRIDSACQGEEGLALVESSVRAGDPYSLAFVDIRMPLGWDGIETIGRIWSVDPNLQVVICSAYSDYSWDQIIRRLGHSDNFLILRKPFDNVEVIQMAHALARKWALARQAESRLENAESAARLSEERFSAAFYRSPMPMSIQSLPTRQLMEVNERFVALCGYSRSELLNPPSPAPDLLVPSSGSPVFWESLSRGEPVRECPGNIRTKAGELRPVRVSAELLQFSAEPLALIVTNDVSEQVRIEGELRQAQKMEAIGHLAAGVAHDFNNHLTIILGHLSLLLEHGSFESPVDESIHQALRAGQRAAALTRQLLAFSRKQVMERKAINVGELFGELESLLQRALGEHIRVIFSAPADLPPVYADPGNLEQVILNLAVNARDAMPQGGELRIRAEAVCVSKEIARSIPDATAGTFIHLSVTDTGCGMDESTKAKAFEPFFTTKEKGRGTGMGLAMVYGLVKQHQGWIQLASQPGRGTTFDIFLPVAVEIAKGNPASSAPVAVAVVRGSHGGATILVVEDEEMIAQYVQRVLERHGYRILLARDGVEAMRLWQNRKGAIDLLLTDIVMPNGMSGKDLAERLNAEVPEFPIIFTSGYSLDVLGVDPKLGSSRYLLQKPYQSEVLLDTIRRALEARGAGPGHLVHDLWSELSWHCDKPLPSNGPHV